MSKSQQRYIFKMEGVEVFGKKNIKKIHTCRGIYARIYFKLFENFYIVVFILST